MTRDRSEDILLRIASAMVDDEAVDWEREASADPDLKRRVHNLRLVQSISDANRELRREILAGTETLDASAERTWGKLILRARLGAGAYGEVYRATDPDLGCDVALKLQTAQIAAAPDGEARFMREARQLARVRHPNVVRVLGADKFDGRVGLWTELIEGQTLEDRLAKDGRLGADEAAAVGTDLCRALAAVHGAGLIHRDVKTSNVLREEGGRIVLLDFSAAANRIPATDSGEAGEPLSGTPRFMAPELFRGRPASVQSDIFSLGVVLYRLVTLAYPIEATTLTDLAERHRLGKITPLRDKRPDLPQAFIEVVEKALAHDPADRFASAGEMWRALEGRAVAGRRWLKEALPAAAVLLLAILAVVGWQLRGARGPIEVDAAFHRIAGTSGHQPLSEGDTLELGDRLHLEIETSHDAYAYVINQDHAGNRFALFPLPGLDLRNPLRGGRRHELPGTAGDSVQDWEVTVSGGTETFLVIVSEDPLPMLEDVIARIPAATVEPVAIEESLVLRGLGGTRARQTEIDGSTATSPEMSDLLVELAVQDQTLWVERYKFRGPSAPGS